MLSTNKVSIYLQECLIISELYAVMPQLMEKGFYLFTGESFVKSMVDTLVVVFSFLLEQPSFCRERERRVNQEILVCAISYQIAIFYLVFYLNLLIIPAMIRNIMGRVQRKILQSGNLPFQICKESNLRAGQVCRENNSLLPMTRNWMGLLSYVDFSKKKRHSKH